MLRKAIYIILLFIPLLTLGQKLPSGFQKKWIAVAGRDSLRIDSVSIQPFGFKVFDRDENLISSDDYSVDFPKALLVLKSDALKKTDSITVYFLPFPKYLTRLYKVFDDSLIVNRSQNLERVYSLENKAKKSFIPFDGLNTSGSITRGVTVGNNQNSVLKSELDLQISGDLGNGVTLRASIQDNNIPIQENGFSQRLDEFDEVFIELFTKDWNIRAGDVNLINSDSYFSRFQKKVQGVYAGGTIQKGASKTTLFGSGAIVRGQFARSNIQGREGNQGPYKLQGPNGELFVLIVSGSETIYVNGLALKRGEDNDYVIDYNAGEITFTSLFPITSEMRITVEYQFSDRNFTRFTTYDGAEYQRGKLKLGGKIFSESDSKNQPLQQNLSQEQIGTLTDAGDDPTKMVAPSALSESFSENKILYKKVTIDGFEAFEFSNNPTDTLFTVRFSQVGQNQGNYILSNTNVVGRIFTFVTPVNGVKQGDFEPVIQLVAPTQLQIATFYGQYDFNEKSSVQFESAFSNNDLNLFSSLDDQDNAGFAGTIRAKHQFFKKTGKLEGTLDYDYVNKDFQTIERLYNIEFDRDWNLNNSNGTQNFIRGGLQWSHPKNGIIGYQFQHLSFDGNAYSGSRQLFQSNLHFNRWNIAAAGSYLDATSEQSDNTFLRLNSRITYSLNKQWFGNEIRIEDNKQRDAQTQILSSQSQKFNEYKVFTGVGDSTKIFMEIGFKYRVNDSLRNNLLEKVNTSNTYFLKSRLINNVSSQLQIFANYRTLNNTNPEVSDEQSLNSRIFYNQYFLDKKVQLNTVFETNSGTQPQQE
ncbi:MAG: hypothetical protein Q8J97_11380, partial [Flavobacteriaceae bacterium]|nr:hypothetical protein [Flavobacteriaceae bacterium]